MKTRVGVRLGQKLGVGNEKEWKDILSRSNSIQMVGGVRDMGQERQCVNTARGFWKVGS